MTYPSLESELSEAEAAVVEAESRGESCQLLDAKVRYSKALFGLGQRTKAIEQLKEAEALARSTKSSRHITVLIGLGTFHKKIGNYREAIEWFERAELKLDITNDQRIFTNVVNNKANVYVRMGDLSSAEHYYKMGLKALKELPDDYFNGVIYTNLSLLEIHRLNYHAADVWAQRAVENIDMSKRPVLYIEALIGAASSKLYIGDIISADGYLQEVQSLLESVKNVNLEAMVIAMQLRIASAKFQTNFAQRLVRDLDAFPMHKLDSDTVPFILKSKAVFYETIGDQENLIEILTTSLQLALDENEGLEVRNSAGKLRTIYSARGDSKMVAEMLDKVAYAKYMLLAFSHEHAIRGLGVVQDLASMEAAFDAEMVHETRLVNLQTELEEKKHKLSQLQERVQTELAHVTHDLKNPLSNLLLLSKLVLASPEDESEQWDEFVRDAETSAVAIRNLVHRIPEVIKVLRSGEEIQGEEFSIGELLHQVLSEYKLQANEKNIRIAVNIETMGTTSIAKGVVELVFRNIVSNAVKYSQMSSQIHIDARESRLSYEVRVTDSGPGFSAQDREQLFTSMQSLSARPTGGEDSSGVGLAVAKNIAEKHGVSVTLENTSSSGSTFLVEVPIAEH